MEIHSLNCHSLAKRFSRCLDNDDFDGAAEFIDDHCLYVSGKETYRGPREITESYKSHSDYARDTFDRVEYESLVSRTSSNKFCVTYIDHLTKSGLDHSYECRQRLEFNDLGKICKIEHEEIEGEIDRLYEFYENIGLR